MNELIKHLARFTVALCIVLIVVYLTFIGLLIFAPRFILNLLYYSLIAGCIVAVCYLIVCLISTAIAINKVCKAKK